MELTNVEFLTGLLGKSAGELSEALKKEDGEPKTAGEILSFLNDSLKPVVTDKIQAAKSDGKDEGYGRAKREVLTDTEKDIAKKYDIDLSDIEGGIEAVVQTAIEKNSKRDDMDPETIRQSDVYKNDIQSLKSKYEDIKSKFDNYQTEVKQSQVQSVVEKQALAIIEEENYALPEDESLRENWKKAYVQKLMGEYKWDIDEDGNPVPYDSDGNPVRDDLHNTLDTKALATKVASQYFPKVKGGNGKTPGAGTQPPNGGGGGEFNLPEIKSHSDFYDKYNEIKDPKAREAFKETYKAKVENGDLPQE